MLVPSKCLLNQGSFNPLWQLLYINFSFSYTLGGRSNPTWAVPADASKKWKISQYTEPLGAFYHKVVLLKCFPRLCTCCKLKVHDGHPIKQNRPIRREKKNCRSQESFWIRCPLSMNWASALTTSAIPANTWLKSKISHYNKFVKLTSQEFLSAFYEICETVVLLKCFPYLRTICMLKVHAWETYYPG